MKKKRNFEALAERIAANKAKFLGLATTVAAGLPMTAKAGGFGGTEDAGGIVVAIAEVVVGIFPLIGAFFLISGVFKLIMAYRNDQPESQSAAAKDIVIGAVFMAFRVFVWPAISGFF